MRFKDLPLHARHTFYYDLRSGLLIGVFGGFLMPFIPIIGRKIGASDFQVALLAASPYIANTFTLLWTEDVFGKGRVWYVVWPGALGRLILLGMFYVTAPLWYTVVIFAYMIVTAIPFPSYASIMKTNYPDEHRGRLMAYVRVGIAVSWVAASALAGWVLEKDTYNFRYIFPAAAVFGALSALQFRSIRVRREKRERVSFAGPSHLLRPLRDGAFLRFVTVYSLFEFGLLMALPVFPLVLVDEVNISNLATGVYGSIFSSMWLLGFFFWGRQLDARPVRRVLVLIFAIAAATPLLYLFTRDIYALGVAQAAAGFTFAALELTNYVVVTRIASEGEVARYTAANIAIGGIRGATAPFLGTALFAVAGGSAVFGISLAMCLGALLLAPAMVRM
ncbi:MAG: MFS transporter [Deltaproteobacteria bacterium]|nr:MFS transporter [Deltaproteobacteria bacterium]